LGDSFRITGTKTFSNPAIAPINTAIARMISAGLFPSRIPVEGIARICLDDGTICETEIHWYEAHGIDRKEFNRT
jgi:hypothetical protein